MKIMKFREPAEELLVVRKDDGSLVVVEENEKKKGDYVEVAKLTPAELRLLVPVDAAAKDFVS